MTGSRPVAIVGAGPVGLFLACLLASSGRAVVVLEKGKEAAGSRSIGIHPPALEALQAVGVADEFVESGFRIERAQLYTGTRYVGNFALRSCPPPYRFVLTLPQNRTEEILERRLDQLQPGALRRGECVVGLQRTGDGFELELDSGEFAAAPLLIGCDGRASTVRSELGVGVAGGSTGDHYLMADLPEEGHLGRDAAIFLGASGVVESFPLPGRMRRWVARVEKRPEEARLEELRVAVAERTGIRLQDCAVAAARFTAERRLARKLVGPDWALVGDAAHVISPIGGQGMNLGLLGAHLLFVTLTGTSQPGLAHYDRVQSARARRAVRRAGFNMFLGRGRLPGAVRRSALQTVLVPAIQRRMARYYTMRGV